MLRSGRGITRKNIGLDGGTKGRAVPESHGARWECHDGLPDQAGSAAWFDVAQLLHQGTMLNIAKLSSAIQVSLSASDAD